jgi:ubiquinone/menaquinone biosynthesis C-methylase UbiE
MNSFALPALRKPYGGMQMEGPLATWYARTTRDRPDYPLTASTISARLPAGGDVLEVAPGPGYLSLQLAQLGPTYRISGIDISRSFVRIATDNARRAGLHMDFRHGDVAAMPFASESFDYVVCQAAFKNFPDPVAALNEIHRVLRPGAQASILDMRKDASSEDIDREIQSMELPAAHAFVTRLIFRYGLLRAAYTRDALAAVVARSVFGRGEINPDGIGFELRLARTVV